jgi:hypothetical protein
MESTRQNCGDGAEIKHQNALQGTGSDACQAHSLTPLPNATPYYVDRHNFQ